MRYRALLLLGVAVILGGVAAYMVNSIVSRQIAEQAEMTPQRVRPTVVAAVDLSVGLDLQRAHLRVVDLPEAVLPEGSYASIEEVLATEPSVVTTPMQANEVVLPAKISTGVPRRGLTAKIPDGKRAVAIPVDEVRGVGGFVLPGDRVDVLHTTAVGRRDDRPVTRTLLQDMTVLGVDQRSSENEEDPVVVNVVTLLAEPEEAKTLTLAQQVGELTLALRNEGDSGKDSATTVALNDLWTWGPEEMPVRPVGAQGGGDTTGDSERQESSRRSVQVIRGLDIRREPVAPGDGGSTAEADESAN